MADDIGDFSRSMGIATSGLRAQAGTFFAVLARGSDPPEPPVARPAPSSRDLGLLCQLA